MGKVISVLLICLGLIFGSVVVGIMGSNAKDAVSTVKFGK